MVEKPVLSVKNVSKTFKRSAKLSLTEEADKTERPVLDNISFELQSGDVLGLIGNNGAGKSTLLKIISGLIAPDAGEIRYTGRLASILEVGSGFHLDLSGRENIYMAGQLFGLRKQEIEARIADVVQFSGQEDHLDVPVKHYSNGMFLRLAFSVATTFPSDILLLDEVMSVGDMRFQEMSVERIRQITRSGTTVIFASHELGAVQMLCNKVLLLDQGKMNEFGDPTRIIQGYLEKEIFDRPGPEPVEPQQSAEDSEKPLETAHHANEHEVHDAAENDLPNEMEIVLHDAYAYPRGKNRGDTITSDDSVCVHIDFSKEWHGPVILSAVFSDKFRNSIMSLCNYRPAIPSDLIDTSPPGRYPINLILPKGFFNAGLFRVGLYFADSEQRDILTLPDQVSFRVDRGAYQLKEFKNEYKYPGPLLPFGTWKLE